MFDDMIADMESNKKLSPVATELFLRVRKRNISLVFISRSLLKVPKTIRLNATPYFIMKIPNKRELQKIASYHSFDIKASNHSPDMDFKDFLELYKQYAKEPYLFLVSNTILSLDNIL